ncbi:uncharacterized protein L3040_002603 [Drepanopeziza brunnea f. sp. 'multigermtubi']|uniref:uncharacterized protein n=1 Tax=Drepanopeziza brunnea f. sp. 'multigermtubi' TaxID=698441 RepID=UPI0023842B19|nr:hypothetical protein L3040_002603 [Drepanopeziza brunnea f. sp. 'multigermtubi']
MPPPPLAHGGQFQSLTTTLRNICDEYPAGGTVLRELLQNADDAGATEVKFVLDNRSHPAEDLMHPKLAQYQGPALLAYNNAVFSDTDFRSLRSIGDSQKINDGSTTGRYGRGFNSVYHWTDSPTVLSRNVLFILDPHKEWSPYGGEQYDFVEYAADTATKNHMEAFESVIERADRHLDGTVIRIPLRTQERAAQSEISKLTTTISEIKEVLSLFAKGFGQNGLIFMRHLTKIEFSAVDNSLCMKTEVDDREAVRAHKVKIQDAVKEALNDPTFSFEHHFQMGIRHNTSEKPTKPTTTRFLVQHSIETGSMNAQLRGWATKQKFTPWVALATQLPIQSEDKFNGSLFTVLQLPVTTAQPLLIHASFSLSPDRAGLRRCNDQSTQDKNPALWNEWLFQEAVPVTWVKLLSVLSRLLPLQPTFERWPLAGDGRDPLSKAVDQVISIIQKENIALWPTCTGYVKSRAGFLASGSESAALKEALREAQMPVVYVPEKLDQLAKALFLDNLLGAGTLCTFLNSLKSQDIAKLSAKSKNELLGCILSDPEVIDYQDLEVFPFEDGQYRSIKSFVFVHRNEMEKALFNEDKAHTLDLVSLSKTSQQRLKDACDDPKHSLIQYRSTLALRSYCMETIFKDTANDHHSQSLDAAGMAVVSQIWDWISEQHITILDENIASLWLLPLSNSRYRKLVCPSYQVYIAPSGEVGRLMRRLDDKMIVSAKEYPLLKTRTATAELMGSDSLSLVASIVAEKSVTGVVDGADLIAFARWLHQAMPLVEDLDDEDRKKIRKVLCSELGNHAKKNALGDELVGIAQRPVVWTSLNSRVKSIGISDMRFPFPEIRDLQYLSTVQGSFSESVLTILDLMGLPACPNPVEIVESYILPAWCNMEDRNWSDSCKEKVAAYVLRQFTSLSRASQRSLKTIPMVPVSTLDGNATSKFACATELIHPRAPGSLLTLLCFPDEEIVPWKDFITNFQASLMGCGLKADIDEAVVNGRVKCFASGKYPLPEVERRAKLLLGFSGKLTLDTQTAAHIQNLAWLPATNANGVTSLKRALECRGIKDKLLVGSQFPIVEAYIADDWRAHLGWDHAISTSILLSQLKHGIEMKDRKIVDAVLSYISKHNLVDSVASELATLCCVFAGSDLFVEPSRAFRPTGSAACRDLNPYFANVDPEFWQSHEILLEKLNVRDDDLGVLDLLRVQDMLEAKDRLDDNDVKVAVEILRIASRFTGTGESLAGLKILGESRQFYTFQEIRSSGGPEDSGDFKFTHPDIPLSISNLLGIDSVRDRILKEMLEMEEDEDDEFDQVEDAMSRIADTLDRYPIETTFREYLANADDTQGASKIRWLLDRREHAYESLMTPEMKVLQGPALLSYNDGVFSERDFDGFKNVGQGSKMQDKETIGQFGRGSQTMFHFTSSPMILSGDYLLILDPEQKILPFNRLKGRRKPGMKLKLSRVAKAIPNLLAPFAGHFGFKTNMAHYPGTIFRFPLLLPGCESALRRGQRGITCNEVYDLMESYFNEARMSLLFIQRIKSIGFHTVEKQHSGWSIIKVMPSRQILKPFLGFVTCSFKIYARDSEELQADGLDEWWVSIENAAIGTDLPPESSRRVTKRTECGIAALVYRTYTQKSPGFNFPTTTTSRMFNTLPLPIFSDLPVHVHATFTLSGDRKSIVLDDHNLKSASSESNRHFLEQEIPKMYLQFLAGLVVHLQQDVFIFWPQHEPPERSFGLRIWTSFWQQLSQSTLELFPKAQSAAQVLSNTSAGLLDINHAILDNLKAHDSRMLRPLLLNLEVDLLSDVPKPVANQLARIETVRRITGSMLRDLFKSVQSQESLRLEIASNPGFSWDKFVRLLTPINLPAAESVELDGCYVLLMADQSIGRLNLVQDDDTEYESYYIASDEEIELFKFASKSFIATKHASSLEHLLSRDDFEFNVSTLQLSDFRKLLDKRPPVGVPSRLEDLWLARFWQCWNSRSDLKDTEFDEICESEAKIYRATRNGSDVYITPSELDLLPSVVTPSITEHRDLCLSIPGMYMVDPILMPALLMTKEETLNESDSFFRFIKSLSVLAKTTSFHNFVRQEISRENLTKIQDLTFYHLSKAPALASEDSLGAILKSFPLWPNFSALDSINLISANDALIAENPSLLVSWVKNRHLFLDNGFTARGQNAECLSSLGVRKLPPEEMIKDYLLPLPQSVAVNDWEAYRSIMDAIGFAFQSSASILDGLASQSIVSDGNCALKKANHFYDHQVPIFASAFRYETRTRFVHTGIRDCLPWLRRIGLRKSTDHLVSFENYIECIRVMALRTATFTDSDWQILLQERVFRSRVAFNAESEYRRERMAAVAKQQPELCLNQIISQDYLPVCWSQVPFAINEPTSQALGKTAGKGKPDVSVVWLHLQYLKSVSVHLRDNVSQQLDRNRDFLQDLKATYGYLQDHPQETKALFGTNEDAIWLNLESWDFRKVSRADIQDSWSPITALVLASSCDSGPIKAVRQGLMDFEKLLRSLGCSSIHYPTITRSDQHTQESYSATSSLNMLRQAGDLADIAFTSQGRTIKAHKVVLSAVSNVKRAQFCRNLGLKQEDVITYRESIPSEFLSYRTLSVLVDYAYQQPIDWDDMEVTDEDNEDQKAAKLDVLLNLCKGADMWEMLALKSQAEDRMLRAGKMFLNLENCLQLAKRSADANAETFQKLCKAFIEQNMAAVMRAHPQGLD